ncbi:MAG: Flp pilus assembly complex ATPase component TadA [Clostridia bacterium]|nr:Flp pilus assembly complex ATPase component TadA [Clostridia bacterium]
MATVIRNRVPPQSSRTKTVGTTGSVLPDCVTARLPVSLVCALLERLPREGALEELHLRRGRCASYRMDGRTYALDLVTEGAVMDAVLVALCDGSLYARGRTLRQGYLPLEGGVRVGVCGRAVADTEHLEGLYDVTALNFRFPCPPFPCGEVLARRIRKEYKQGGFLLYSPPGEGKTTLLKGLLMQLASGQDGLRIAVIDTREELTPALTDTSLRLDVLLGYPKREGIEIATRCMAPDLLVCDEIGEEEASSVVQAQNAGVSLLASAHGSSVEQMLRRPGMAMLHHAAVFGWYVGLRRGERVRSFCLETMEWEEADERLQHHGRFADLDGRRFGSTLAEQANGCTASVCRSHAGSSSVQ